jgi:hypothetical protein
MIWGIMRGVWVMMTGFDIERVAIAGNSLGIGG